MPQRKKMETPSRRPEISSMTHEEEDEMQHDIWKLRYEVQQISFTQKVTENKMDGLKKDIESKMYDMEAKMDGFKKGMEAKMDGLKKGLEAKMEYLKTDLKLLQ